MVGFLFASNASATFYQAIINKVITQASGDTVLELIPGTGESRMLPVSRVVIISDDPGAKAMLATALTAVSLDSEIKVGTPGTNTVPTIDKPYERCTGLTLDMLKAQ